MRAEVDVWQASLRADDPQLEWMRGVLTPGEIVQLTALRTAALQRRFAAARAFVRSVLAGYLGVPPADVAFERGPAGKPHVPGARLEFNLSHAGEHALCAVALGVPVGIDLERIDPDLDLDEVAACCFAPQEIDALRRLRPRDRQRAFFTTWTRKEAFAKAVGTGLSTPLAGFAVPVRPEERPRLLWRAGATAEGPWTLLDLAVPADYAACLAAGALEVQVRRREWAVRRAAVEPAAA